jgi:hypothetical protein
MRSTPMQGATLPSDYIRIRITMKRVQPRADVLSGHVWRAQLRIPQIDLCPPRLPSSATSCPLASNPQQLTLLVIDNNYRQGSYESTGT